MVGRVVVDSDARRYVLLPGGGDDRVTAARVPVQHEVRSNPRPGGEPKVAVVWKRRVAAVRAKAGLENMVRSGHRRHVGWST